MASKTPEWRKYERVAQFLLNQIAEEFGLERVDGKEALAGATGTIWEVDAKGVAIGGKGIILVECKHYPKRRIDQGTVMSFAGTIEDVGAEGGIHVSPLGLQSGASLVAAAKDVIAVRLNAGATNTEFLMEFVGKIVAGVEANFSAAGTLSVVVDKVIDPSTES